MTEQEKKIQEIEGVDKQLMDIAQFLVDTGNIEDGEFLEQIADELKRVTAERDEFARSDRRLHDMMPLFTEARDALPAISASSATLHRVDLRLADRMDAVGNPDRWNAMDEARQALQDGDGA